VRWVAYGINNDEKPKAWVKRANECFVGERGRPAVISL